MKKKLRTLNILLIVLTLLFSTLPSTTAEAASNKSKAQKVVKTYINSTKTYNIEKMNKCFKSTPKNAFFISKKEMAKYCKKYNKNTTYKIKSTKIKGKSGVIKVSVTSPNCYDIFYSAIDDSFSWIYEYMLEHGKEPSDSKANAYLMKRINYYTQEYGVGYKTHTVTFKMSKTKKGWKIKSATRSIKDIANCQYEKAYNDYF